MKRALLIFACMASLACRAPNAGTTDGETSGTGTTTDGTSDPLVDRCDPSAADPCAGLVGE